MASGIWSAASGAVAQQHMLDVASNNLANSSTTGFRADRAIFEQTLVSAERAGNAAEYRRYATTQSASADRTQGAWEETGRPLDVALDGPGFLAVQTPAGERYTRNGSLQLGADGTLQTSTGDVVLGDAGRPIQVDPEQPLWIGQDGTVLSGDIPVGRIAIVEFQNLDTLEKFGETLFQATPASIRTQQPNTMLVSGALERSNVSVLKGMTELVTATRSFEALEKVIQTFSETERRAAMGIMGRR